MRIGDVSRATGVPASAIRYYEQERLIPPPARVSGRRVFADEDLARLAVVRLAQDAGFTLAEIRRLINEFGENRWRRLASRKLAELEEAARRLETMRRLLDGLLRCRCPDIGTCGRLLRKAGAFSSSRRRVRRPRG